ncbi:hypothetical protein HMPREF3150_02696 [Pseudomonas aeruginosa]|nr:hypothetical protein HMPREF3150_02696 [Pseudomonas aeruginosa]
MQTGSTLPNRLAAGASPRRRPFFTRLPCRPCRMAGAHPLPVRYAPLDSTTLALQWQPGEAGPARFR